MPSWLDGINAYKVVFNEEEDGDVPLPSRPHIIFVGATAEDDPTNNRTRVIIAAGTPGEGADLGNSTPAILTTIAGTAGVAVTASRSDHRHQVSVSSPVAIGDVLAQGSSNNLARADHVHTIVLDGDVTGGRATTFVAKLQGITLTAPSPTAGQVLTYNGSAWVPAAPAGGGGGGTPGGVPLNIRRDVAASGVSTAYAREDHQHDINTTTPVALGDTLAEGTSSQLARADHVHTIVLAGDVTGPRSTTAVMRIRGVPVGDLSGRSTGQVLTWNGTNIVFADPPSGGGGGVSLSDSTPVALTTATGAAGVGGTASRSDHRHQVTTGTPRNVGTANSPGVSTSLVRADHEHALANQPLKQVTTAHTVMEPFGIASHWNAIELYGMLVEAGVEWIRIDLHWYVCKPTQGGAYNWVEFDAAIKAAKGHGLKVLAILGKPPYWANGRAEGSANFDAYAPTLAREPDWSDYVNQTVTRYPEIDAWEIWNEPNHYDFLILGGSTWADANVVGTTDQKRRAELAHLVDLAMAQGDLKHKVVTTSGFASGGSWDAGFEDALAALPDNWLTQFQVGNTHAYGYERPNQYEVIRAQVDKMAAYGVAQGKPDWPIWVTEHGIVLPPGSGSAADDARYLIRSYAEGLRRKNCTKVFWFPSQYRSDHHSLLNASNQRNPLFAAYRLLTQMWRRPVSVEWYDDYYTNAEGAIATLSDGSRVAIVWCDSGTATIAGLALKPLIALDRFGAMVPSITNISGGAPYFLVLSKGWNELTTFPFAQSGSIAAGYVPQLYDTGGGALSWGWAASGGALAGDVTGPSGSNTVSKLQSRTLNLSSASTGQVLTWNGSQLVLATPASGVSLSDVTPAIVHAGTAYSGVSALASRGDHSHQVSTGTPVAVGSANSAGVSVLLSRSDHVHDASAKADKAITITAGNGLTGGGDLSASRTINIVASDPSLVVNADSIGVAMSNLAPLALGATASPGSSPYSSRYDHVHPLPGMGTVTYAGTSLTISAANAADYYGKLVICTSSSGCTVTFNGALGIPVNECKTIFFMQSGVNRISFNGGSGGSVFPKQGYNAQSRAVFSEVQARLISVAGSGNTTVFLNDDLLDSGV